MKKTISVILALMVLLAVLSGCGGSKTDAGGSASPAPAATAAPTATPEPTPEPTPDPTVAVLQLGKEELEIRITDVNLDEEGKLVIPIEGITLKNSWRALIVQVVLGGEKIFMEMSKVNNDGYTRTSNRHFDALPEQVLLFTDGNEETPLVYDVAAGAFVS